MKTNKSRLFFSAGALALCGGLALQGCSSSDDSSGSTTGGSGGKGGTGTGGTSTGGKGGTGAGGTAAGGTAAGGTAGRGGTGGTAGRGGTGGIGVGGDNGAAGDIGAGGALADVAHPSLAECTAFCAMEATVCTAANAAYASTAVCMTDCAAFALGVDTDPTHTTPESGDNFACRAYHLYNASLSPGGVSNAPVHCPHTANVSHNMDGSTAMAPCRPM